MTTFQCYIQQALKHARYHFDSETNQWVGEIPTLPICWASAENFEEMRNELVETIEGYVLLSIKNGDFLPVLENINLEKSILSYA